MDSNKNELKGLYKSLKDNGIPDLDSMIYLSEGMYLLPNGDIIELE